MSTPLKERVHNSRTGYLFETESYGRVFIVVAAVFMSAGFFWAAFFRFDEMVRVEARIRPSGYISTVLSPLNGTIKEKHQENDRVVKAGNLLWVYNTDDSLIRRGNLVPDLGQARLASERTRLAKSDQYLQSANVRASIDGRIIETRGVKVELYVGPDSIALLEPGQRFKLRFSGLPPSEYGTLDGTIRMIPPDISGDQERAGYYVVTAELDDPCLVRKDGTRIPVKAGMRAEARIVLGRKTVLRELLNQLNILF